MKRSTLDNVRESLRMQQVYNVFVRYGWDLIFQRWRLLGSLRHSMQSWVWQLPDEIEEVTTPVKVRLMLEELGPTYVKMGQIVSSQASVIPADWEAELEKLQSDVPPFPATVVREILEEELGAVLHRLLQVFPGRPLGALFAAVHALAAVGDALAHTSEERFSRNAATVRLSRMPSSA